MYILNYKSQFILSYFHRHRRLFSVFIQHGNICKWCFMLEITSWNIVFQLVKPLFFLKSSCKILLAIEKFLDFYRKICLQISVAQDNLFASFEHINFWKDSLSPSCFCLFWQCILYCRQSKVCFLSLRYWIKV